MIWFDLRLPYIDVSIRYQVNMMHYQVLSFQTNFYVELVLNESSDDFLHEDESDNIFTELAYTLTTHAQRSDSCGRFCSEQFVSRLRKKFM